MSPSSPQHMWEQFRQLFQWKVVLRLAAAAAVLFTAWAVWIYAEFHTQREERLSGLARLNLQVQGGRARLLSEPTLIYDQNGQLLTQIASERRRVLSLEVISELDKWQRTLITAEDQEFYQHDGYHLSYLFKAALRSVWYGKLSGGSTLTQQLAKLLFTDSSRTPHRKLLEILYADEIEERFDKKTILAMYLNKIFFGHNRYGVQEASRFFFNKNPDTMNWSEVALLVGIIPNPTAFSPLRHLQKAMYKQRLVLRLLEADGLSRKMLLADHRQFLKEWKVPSSLAKRFADPFADLKPLVPVPEAGWSSRIGKAGVREDRTAYGHIKEEVRRFIVERFGTEKLEDGMHVFTTIDRRRQQIAFATIGKAVAKMKKRLKQKGEGVQAALVTVEPRRGYIEAMVGGTSFTSGNQLNRVYQSYRQTGSSIKPLVYLLALEQGKVGPLDCLPDEPFSKAGYRPRNWYRGYKGDMLAAQALAQSVNTAAVRLLDRVGPEKMQKVIGQMLELDDKTLEKRFAPDLSMALGSKEMTPLELARIYATILNRGRLVYPHLITKVLDQDYSLVYGQDPRVHGPFIFDQKAVFETIQMMQYVLGPGGTIPHIHKRRSKGFLPFPAAGKTGSTQLSPQLRKVWRKTHKGLTTKDVWFAGLTSRAATVVWMGNDKGAPIAGGGSSVAAPIWADYLQAFFRDKKQFPSESRDHARQRLERQNPALARVLFERYYKEKSEKEKALQQQEMTEEDAPAGSGSMDDGSSVPVQPADPADAASSSPEDGDALQLEDNQQDDDLSELTGQDGLSPFDVLPPREVVDPFPGPFVAAGEGSDWKVLGVCPASTEVQSGTASGCRSWPLVLRRGRTPLQCTSETMQLPQ
jgi:penicillin-binding protein 1A